MVWAVCVSDACQINDLDHFHTLRHTQGKVSDACQINDLDHPDRATDHNR